MAAKTARARRVRRQSAAADMKSKALALGASNARKAIRRYALLVKSLTASQPAKKTAKPPAGTLIFAEGDSWFDYPLCDVLTVLRHTFGYVVEKVSHAGDTVESMAYDPDQLASVVERYRDLQTAGREPRAILLSGGGNDIAGSAIESLLNHKNDPTAGFNESVMAGVFDERIRAAMVAEIGALSEIHRAHFGHEPRILIHGYDYAVPDNRGYLTGIGPLPGPWLAPQFRRRGYRELGETSRLMRTLIDRFNAMAKSVAGGFHNVVFVELRGTLKAELAGKRYEKDWANELHPTQRGFGLIAWRFNEALQQLL